MNNDNFRLDEDNITSAFEEVGSVIELPDSDVMWAKIERRLQSEAQGKLGRMTDWKESPKKNQRRMPFRLLIAVAVIIVFGSLLYLPDDAIGIKNRAINLFVSDSGLNLNLQRDGQNSPNQNELQSGNPVVLTLEEAKRVSPFNVSVPSILPQGTRLEKIELQKLGDPVALISIYYIGKDFDLIIRQKNVIGETVSVNQNFRQGETNAKELKVKGVNAVLFINTNGNKKLVFINNGVEIKIEATLSEEEIIRVAESM